MAYATTLDMVKRFGETEMIRLSATADALPDTPDEAKIGVAVTDATGLIDSYLRARYQLPLSPPPVEIVRACCILARFDLQLGDGKTPTEEALTERRQIERWLEALRDGASLLDAPQISASLGGVITSDRQRDYSGRGLP